MNRDYTLASPSLQGVLGHDCVTYGGFHRTEEIRSICDRPGTSGVRELRDPKKREAVERYLSDLYTVFVKRLTSYAMESEPTPHEDVALTAMLQEFIKIKNMLAKNI